MNAQSVLGCEFTDSLHFIQRKNLSRASVVCVFYRDQLRVRKVDILWTNVGGNLLRRYHALLAIEWIELDPGQHRRSGDFIVEDVTIAVADNFVAASSVGGERDLVRHRAARDEQRGLFSEERRHAFLKRDYRRVVAEDVVTNFCLGHGPAHFGARTRDRVAP